MDILVFIIVVTAIGSLKVGLLGAFLFSLALVLGIYLIPLILMAIVGIVWTPIRKVRKSPDPLMSAEGIRRTQSIGSVSQILAYIAIVGILLVYRNGELLVAGLVGLAIYLGVSFMWGDLPFQKPKNPQGEA